MGWFGLSFMCLLAICLGSALADAQLQGLCQLAAQPGPCEGLFPGWFYNITSERCESFIYGGCKGNANRFRTKQLCENACVCDVCSLQPNTGPCRAYFPSYFYNTTTRKCESFIYGGCAGNANRFATSAACLTECSSNSSCPIKGQQFEICRSCQGTCDNPLVRCPAICSSGCVCPPGQVVDDEAKECVHLSQCPMKCSNINCPEVDCPNGNITTPAGSCCPVCGCVNGNELYLPGDSFMNDCNSCSCTTRGLAICTLIACKDSEITPANRRCPIEGQEYTDCGTACPQTCRQPEPQACTRQCVQGCQCPRGTVLDEEHKRCVQPFLCPQEPCDMCNLQPEAGPCLALFFRYFWNITSRRCERFIYGGCGGNLNRFSNIASCGNQCACEYTKCPKGSECKVYQPTGEPYCDPSCDIGNGGCLGNETCSLRNVTCVRAPCPPVVVCTDPCENFSCSTGSQCKVFEVTGEAYCEPSCDLDNGGCTANLTCTLQVVQCIRPPCPPGALVQCESECSIKGQTYTVCGSACPPTCGQPQPSNCIQLCVPGCQCPSGTVLDEVKNECVKPNQCTCPPTCSHEYCSIRRNRNRPCSRPPPLTIPACPDQCRSTYCSACYYSENPLSTPRKCNRRVCRNEVQSSCLRNWAKCVHKQNRRRNKCEGDCITAANFRCYDYPPCNNVRG